MDFVPRSSPWVDSPNPDAVYAADANRWENGIAEGITKAEAAQAATASNAAAITSLGNSTTAALDAKANFVLVSTGSEARPAGNFCIWSGGTVQPTNMGANDLWFAAGPPADVVPPSVPTGLASTAISDAGFTVTWTASTGDPTLYEVFIDGTSYGTTASTSLAVTGRTASTTYSVTVRARDAAGNWSAQSSALSVTTSAPPSTPTVKETLQTPDDNAAAATVTTSNLSAGDTIIAYQISSNVTGNVPAVTSTAGAATLIAEYAVPDGPVGDGTARVYRIPVGSSGVKTVTFPNAAGYDNEGIVRVYNGSVLVDAFVTDAAGSASTAYTSPSVTVAGSSDLLEVFVGLGRNGISVADGALTQRAVVKSGTAIAAYLYSRVLSASGATPTHAFTLEANRQGASIVLGLKSA